MSHPSVSALAAALVLSLAPRADAQCADWTPGFGSPVFPELLAGQSTCAVFDDGSGPHAYVASGLHVLRWTGSDWETLLERTPGLSFANLRATLDGATPVLLAVERSFTSGTNLSNVWRFDGATWTQLGSVNYLVWEADFLDDGTTTSLVVAGGDVDFNIGHASRWNGSSWQPIGAALDKHILALSALRIGGVSRLYIGGVKASVGTACVGMWDGSTWQPVAGLDANVLRLRTYDGGSGEKLYAQCSGVTTGGSLRVFDGATWTDPYPSSSLAPVEVVELGAGPRLLLSGSSAPGALGVFDGTNITPLSTPGLGGYPTSSFPVQPNLRGAASYVDGGTPHLFVAGGFGSAGGLGAVNFAEWNGTTWKGAGRGLSGPVNGFTRFDFGSGPELVTVGSFVTAGNSPFGALGSARWDGQQWRNFGGALIDLVWPGATVTSVASCDFGSGPVLFAGGVDLRDRYRGFMKLGTIGWFPPLADFGNVFALCPMNLGAGPRLVVGGQFTVAGFGPGENIFQYDGATNTATPLGSGMNNLVSALCVHDEGSGPRLFAAGVFTTAGGVSAQRIARWDGASWSALGTGLVGGGVNALCSFDGKLWAFGAFTSAGGTPVQHVARWDGSVWSDVPGGGADGLTLAACVHDDGRGPALYVGGGFATIGGITAYNLARCDGASWEAVDGGLSGPLNALTSHDDDGDGDAELFAGGNFLRTATMPSGNFARLEGCPHYTAFCFGDGSFTDHTTPCPCGNNGAPGNGCAHSFDAGGANLSAAGSTSLDTVVLHAQFEPVSSFTLFLQQANQGDAVFHDGVLCAANPLVRIRGRGAVGGEAFFPNASFAQDTTTSLSIRGGVTTGSGVTRYYSAFYRNASTTFCPPATANVTNGVRVIW